MQEDWEGRLIVYRSQAGFEPRTVPAGMRMNLFRNCMTPGVREVTAWLHCADNRQTGPHHGLA